VLILATQIRVKQDGELAVHFLFASAEFFPGLVPNDDTFKLEINGKSIMTNMLSKQSALLRAMQPMQDDKEHL